MKRCGVILSKMISFQLLCEPVQFQATVIQSKLVLASDIEFMPATKDDLEHFNGMQSSCRQRQHTRVATPEASMESAYVTSNTA